MPISLSELTWGVKNPLVFQCQPLQQTVLHVYPFQKHCSVDTHLQCRLLVPLKRESLVMDVTDSLSPNTLGINQGRRREKIYIKWPQKCSLEHFNDASGSNQGCCWALERALRSGRILLAHLNHLGDKSTHSSHPFEGLPPNLCLFSSKIRAATHPLSSFFQHQPRLIIPDLHNSKQEQNLIFPTPLQEDWVHTT